RREPRLPGSERALHALGLGRRLLRLRDIARHLRRADDAPVGVADGRNAERDVEPPAVLRAPHGLEMRYRVAAPDPGDHVVFLGEALLRNDQADVPADRLGGVLSEDSLRAP